MSKHKSHRVTGGYEYRGHKIVRGLAPSGRYTRDWFVSGVPYKRLRDAKRGIDEALDVLGEQE